jgi:hypothetical protein
MNELLEEFRIDSGIVYPPFSLMYFEKFFYNYIQTIYDNELIQQYIPVFWTELQISHYNQNKLQNIINKLDTTKRYFTIVQHDDGINIYIPNNVRVFGMGGHGNIPLPLTYENPKVFENYKTNQKQFLCSFVGSITHYCRQIMVDQLCNKSDILIMANNVWTHQIELTKQKNFLRITASSKFTLCPRGYGKTSFRLYEALKLRSIPIYIYDECFLPYTEILDWSKLAILVHINDISNIYSIITSITETQINEMLEYYKKYEYLFTYEGMCDYIINLVDEGCLT